MADKISMSQRALPKVSQRYVPHNVTFKNDRNGLHFMTGASCSFCFLCQSDVKKPRSTKYLHTVVLQETGSTVTKTVQLTLKQSAVSSTAARMNNRLETTSSHSPTPPGSPSVLNVSVNSYCEVTFIFFCSLEMQCKGFSALPSYSPT